MYSNYSYNTSACGLYQTRHTYLDRVIRLWLSRLGVLFRRLSLQLLTLALGIDLDERGREEEERERDRKRE